jgi:hypothetical protein
MDDLDQDIDRLIENIKKEFQNLNLVINNIEMKKADFKEFEKINTSLSKKIEYSLMPVCFISATNSGQISLCLFKYSASNPANIFILKATLSIVFSVIM